MKRFDTMVFRSIKSDLPATRAKTLPIQGMIRRTKSGDGLIAVLPPVTAQHPKISRSALHRIFAGMLGSVFICYCCLMLVMIQHRDSNVFAREGKWGPTMATSQQVLRDHIQNLAEQKRKEIDKKLQQEEEEQEKNPDNAEGQQRAKNVTVGALGHNNNLHDSFENLEEIDIHDMKPPEAVQQNKDQEKKKKSNMRKSKPDPVLTTATD